MTNKITMQLEVLANTKQAEAAAKKLEKDFQKAVNPPTIPSGAMKQASIPSTAMQGRMDSRDSNMSRGLGGLTGAEGRDFAKQAQGLGGLVHVYATFAANVFALSAAFTALSKAADVTNMTKGLDQLGAASGRALGSLSKQLVAVTDGAISMREAMTATAQASAGGMTNASILRMGEVAKQASQALGVAMPDALSRISRGITKLEPELLDEIGIMVRVDRTSQEYAASIGKTTAALTDFEKRQAFANAVLEQGEKKFGAIKLDANPYAKILASMENIAQTGLELVNKVLSPILTILSSSPTALATAMAGVAAILIKQAVPAIGSFRESLKAGAENATKLANIRNIAAKNAAIAEIATIRKLAEDKADVELEAFEASTRKLDSLRASSKLGKKSAAILDKQPSDVTEKELQHLDLQASKLEKKNSIAAAGYREAAISIRNSKQLEIEATEAVTRHTAALTAKHKLTTTAGQFQRSVDRDNLASISRNITSIAAETAATSSFGKAWKDAGDSVRQAKLPGQFISITDSLGKVTQVAVPAMGAMQGFWTMTKVGAVGAISAIGTAISAFMPWLAVIGLVSGVLSSVYSYFSTSAKQAEKFTTSLTALSDAAENAVKTLDVLNSKDFAEQLDPKSVQARANAFLEVSEAVTKTVKSFKDLAAARNGAENAMEWLYSLVGFGDSDKLSKAMGIGVSNSLKLLSDNPDAQKAAKSALQSLLGNDVELDAPQSIVKALKKLDDGELVSIGASIEGLFKKVNLDINNSASRLTSFVDGISSLSKTITEANNRLNPTDDSFKLGVGLIGQSLALTKILEDGPIKSIAALNALINDSKNLSLLPQGTSDTLIEANIELKEIQKTLGQNLKLQQLAETQLAKAKADKSEKFKSNAADTGFYADQNKKLSDIVNKQQAVVDNLRKEGANLSNNATETIKGISETLSKDIFEAGGKRLTQSLETAMVSAAVVAGGAYLSVIKSIGGDTAAAESELRKIEINQQRSVVEATYASIQAIEKNTLAIRQTNATKAMETAMALDEGRNSAIAIARKEQDSIDREKKIQTQDPRTTLKQLSSKDSTKEDRDAFAAQSTFVQGLIGYKVQMAAIDAKAYADNVQRMAGLESERVKNAQKAADSTIKAAQLEKSKLDIAKGIVGTYDEELANASILNERAIAINENLKIREEIQGKINVASNLLASGKGSEEAKKAAQSALDKAKIERTENTAAGMQKQNEIDAKAITDKIAGEKALAKLSQDRAATAAKTSSDIKLADIEANERAIKYALDIGSITVSDGIKKQESLALDKQSLDYTNQKLTLATLLLDVEEKRKNLERISAAGQNTTEASAAFAAAAQNYTSQIALVDSRNASITQGIKLTSEHAQMQAKQNERLKEAQSFTESLTSLFGEMGTNLGKVGESLANAASSMELMAKRKEELDKKGASTDSSEYKKYIKDKTNAELTSMANIAGASKKLFKEKSVGFKALEAVEKGFHLWKLGANIAEAASTAMKDQSSIAGSIMRATVDAGAAVIKAISSMPFPLNIAAGAATALAVGSILGSIGGGGISAPSGPSVEDQQKASGTGQSYNSEGRLVDNGGGALGDTSAKSTAILNGIEKLRDINYEMLQFSQNRTYDALLAIKDNTESFVKAVGSRLGGVGTNSAFGTKEGESFNANMIGKNPALSIAAVGIVGTLFKGPIDKLTEALGLGSIFGEKVDRKVQDQGITVKGTLGALSAGGGTKQIYENIRDEWSSFLDSGVNEFTQTKKLDDKVDEYIVGIFKGFNAMLVSAAEALGTTGSKVEGILNASEINLKVSSKGLTGAEYAEAIMSEVGIQLDIAATKVFPELPALKTKFQELGETNTDFIVRLIYSSEQVGYALDSINKSMGSISGLALTEASLSLEKLAGGLGNFVSLTNEFGELFLTDAERLAPVTRAVNTELGRLGISTKITRDEFKQLVLSQDLTTESGREMYIALLKLAPAFDKVVPAIEETAAAITKILTATELASARMDQYITILGLTGQKEEALRLTRAKELAGMDERLRGTQTYIYMLQDLAKAQEAFNGAMSSLGDTLFGLQNQLLTAQGAANGGAGAVAAKAQIQQNNRTRDLAKMTAGTNAVQTAAITTAYDYNLAITNQIDAQNEANTANAAAKTANEALAAAQANAAQSAADSAQAVADAAKAVKEAWQLVSDSLFEEVKRIRGLVAEGAVGTLEAMQAEFNAKAAAAKAGDSEAAKLLPGLSQSLLELTEQTATSSIDLKRAQARTAGSLEDVGRTINAQYGLFGPEDTLARSQAAMNEATANAAASAASSAAASAAAVSAAQATATAANATAAAANSALDTATTASATAKKVAEDAWKIAKEKGETILTLEEWLASQQYTAEKKAYDDSILAQTNYFTTMLGLQTSFTTASISALTVAINSAVAISNAAITTAQQTSAAAVNAPSATLPGDVGPPKSSGTGMSIGNTYYNRNNLPTIQQFAVGTDYVPKDMIAMIHEGEKITPKAYNTNQNQELIKEIQALRQEVSMLRDVALATGSYTKKTSDTLTRVTLGGESMQTTVIASVPVPVA